MNGTLHLTVQHGDHRGVAGGVLTEQATGAAVQRLVAAFLVQRQHGRAAVDRQISFVDDDGCCLQVFLELLGDRQKMLDFPDLGDVTAVRDRAQYDLARIPREIAKKEHRRQNDDFK